MHETKSIHLNALLCQLLKETPLRFFCLFVPTVQVALLLTLEKVQIGQTIED